ncbi:MAG: tetratricopeptide repeat protein [Myxococcota bacterium]
MPVSLFSRLLCSTLALFCLSVTSPDVHAKSAEEEAANVLYTDGQTAFERGRYSKALTLFQRANEVLENDFIRFYLGRSYTALNQCEQALEHFDQLSAPLPPAPREQRRQDEVRCRLRLAAAYLDGYRCHESLETLKPIDRQVRHPDSRRQFAALQATAKQCTDVFGTRTSVGQRAARFYAEARSAMRKGNTPLALKLSDKSLAAKPSRPAAAVEAIALGKLGRCQVAIPRLEAAMPHANAEDAHIMGELSVSCRLSEGKRLLKGGSCYQIIQMLEPLKGKLKGADDLWRRQKINWCRPHATPFPTDTAPRKSAYALFKEARTARDGGGDAAAGKVSSLYAMALKLADEPVIRRELAHAQVPAQGCEAAAATMAQLAEELQTDADKALIETCRRYVPEPALTGGALAGHVRGVLEVLALRDAGVHLQAISRLDALATKGSPGCRGLRADLLYGAGRCDDYVAEVDGIPASDRARVSDVAQRLAECREPVEVAATPSSDDAPAVTPESTVVTPSNTPSPSGDEGRLLPWITVGSGAALMTAGVAFTVAWAEAQGRYDEARQHYDVVVNAGVNLAGDNPELSARLAMDAISDEQALYSGLAIGLGAAGAVALGVGLFFALTDAGDSGSSRAPALSLYPVVSPSHLGLGGRF